MSTRLKTILWVLFGAAAMLALIGAVTFQLPAFGGSAKGARLERMHGSPQFIEGRFENTPRQDTDGSLVRLYKLYAQGQVREPRFAIPVMAPDSGALQTPPRPGMRAIWFGHASTLIEIDGVRVMVDPVFANIVSPIPVGLQRFHAPPVPLEQLPRIDAVMISHDHYDHLDMKTVQHLAARGTRFLVGLGIGAHLERWGVPDAQIIEMDWWDSIEINGVRIDCTPARHYSGRKRMNNPTLWASWAVRGPTHSVYYSGDTGYAGHFAEIRRRLGAMDLTVMKVGAYGTPWLDIHMDPESAVKAHGDLGGTAMLPVHWATFNLAYHAWEEPIVRTLAAAQAVNARVITPRIGEVFEFGAPFVNVPWYDAQKSAASGPATGPR
jgi:L-ascorbate metabolism protein UlaG (beta-lactamase superfamily)